MTTTPRWPSDTFPTWIYDDSPIDDPFGYGERAVEFLRRLRHPKSRASRRQFQLDPWQERIVRRIYGPRHADGSRVVKTVVLVLPRGNRKTSLAAALALLHSIGPEKVPGGEAIFAASDRTQAGIAFKEALGVVRADKRITRAVKIYDAHNSAKKLVYPKAGTTLEVISSDGGAQHGRTLAFALADEIHIWPNRYLWEALTTSLDKTDDNLLVVATTAGRGQESVAWETIEMARKVARGEIVDPSILPILFEAPRDCDWRDESLWHLVNPGLAHGYPSLDGFRRHAKRAESSIGERQSFLQLKLNVWLDQSTDPFVEMAVFDDCAGPVDLDALKGEPCWLAADMSSVSDLTAVVAAWRDGAGGYIVKPWFFVPEDNLARKAEQDGVPYPEWAAAGHIIATPGNVIDHRAVESHIRGLCQRFNVAEIGFDPAYAQMVMNNLGDDGLPVVQIRQGWRTMSPAIAELERAILGGQFRHDGNPVLRWNFENLAVRTVDDAGNRLFSKSKSTDRIDGAQATAMATVRAMFGETGLSSYSDGSKELSFV